jgi:hypothetical protein
VATQLIVEYGNTKHRFVKNTKIDLTFTGPPEPEQKGSKIGNHIFNLSPLAVGNVFTLKISIPAPAILANAGTPNLLEIKQIMEVIRTPQGVVSVVPHKTTPGNRFVGGFHPRLTGFMQNAGAGHIYHLVVDNAFLDVTALARKANPDYLKDYDAAKPVIATAAPHYGSRMFLMEYTGGKPALWIVNIPDSVKPDRKSIHTLLFFRPIGQAPQKYTFIDEPPLLRPTPFNRYFLDPPPSGFAGPFFVVEKIGTTNNKKLTTTQFCGFERQIAESKQPVIFVTPVPHVGDFGDSANARWATLMPSLVNALWAGDAIGQSVATGLTVGKKVIAGFSHGAMVAFTALQNVPAAPDELYLFDPARFDAPQLALLTAFIARKGRKLRMVGGGMSHDGMIGFAAGKGADVTVKPTAANYWLTDKLYLAAITMTTFEPSTVATPRANSISKLTGLFLVGPASKGIGTALQGRSKANAEIVSSRDVPNMGAVELATESASYVDCFFDPACKTGLDAEFKKSKPPGAPVVPVDTAGEFDRFIEALVKRTKAMRHQWSVAGGEDSSGATDRLGTFKGFLQLCIEAGSFP